MFRNLLCVLGLLSYSFLGAQNVKIAGKFPYQRDVPFSVQTIDVPSFYLESQTLCRDTSDGKGNFSVVFALDKPGILQFERQNSGEVEIYLRPGDSLWVEMINPLNMHFGGTAALENNLLIDLEQYPNYLEGQENYTMSLSNFVDSLYHHHIEQLRAYETDHSGADFAQIYLAKLQSRYLNSKLRLVKELEKSGQEGALLDQIRRQIRALDILDETRSFQYLQTLNDLFAKETFDILGQETPSEFEIIRGNYPAGYLELLQSHIQERLAGRPNLLRYFKIQELVGQIQSINSAALLPAGAKALEQLQSMKDLSALTQQLQLLYRKKEIIYRLQKLPDLRFETPDDIPYQLEPSQGQRTLLVFWNAMDSLNVEAYRRFQLEKEEITGFRSFGNPNEPEESVRLIWVQYGGTKEKWKKVIGQVPNVHQVLHYYLDDRRTLSALKSYFFREHLPIAFHLRDDLGIAGLGTRPSIGMDEFSEVVFVGGRVIWRMFRE
jgi:hypothetical protein